MELFEASSRIRAANRVPGPDDQQLEAARERFIAGIRAAVDDDRDVRDRKERGTAA